MDKEAIVQYERKLKKEVEDKRVFDAIMVLQNCDDYELRKKYHTRLVDLLCSKEYSIESLPENPIDVDIKILIRADFDSYLSKINPNDLSSPYYQALQAGQNNNEQFTEQQYQLSIQKSDSWKIVNQFTSFQKISKYIIKKLSSKQLNPEVVKKMTLNDCMDFVYKNCKSTFRENSLKKKFVQTFIRYNEQDLRKMHHLQGVDARYTDAMVNAMKNEGVSCGIHIHDEKGEKINGPEYHIHHRVPVKHAGEVQCFSEVNMFKNLVLIEKDIYHKLIHICESSEYVANKRYFSKLLPPSNSALISGLETKDVIYYDFENKTKIQNPVLEAVALPAPKDVVYNFSPKIAETKEKSKKPSKTRKLSYKNGGGRRG